MFIKPELIPDSPSCPHGPMIRVTDSLSNSKRFTCSAFRTEGECKLQNKLEIDHFTNWSSRPSLLMLNRHSRAYCITCDCLFDLSTNKTHKKHKIRTKLTKQLLSMPSFLLKPLSNPHSHAQYFFSLSCLNHIYSIIYNLGISHVISIGSPRLHEFIQLNRIHKGQSMTSYLLDIDFRLENFYSKREFSRYNMINGYFFNSKNEKQFSRFMSTLLPNNKCLLFCDPPFGAPLSLIIRQMKQFDQYILSNTLQIKGDINSPLLIVLPYFFENKLRKIAPYISLLDYKITYEKHCRLDCDLSNSIIGSDDTKTGRRRDTIVHLFTNLLPFLVAPPKSLSHQYTFCDVCQRYSHVNNLHCSKCNKCTTKNGATYIHCDQCGYCRTPRKFHCEQCGQCVSKNQCAHMNRKRSKN